MVIKKLRQRSMKIFTDIVRSKNTNRYVSSLYVFFLLLIISLYLCLFSHGFKNLTRPAGQIGLTKNQPSVQFLNPKNWKKKQLSLQTSQHVVQLAGSSLYVFFFF